MNQLKDKLEKNLLTEKLKIDNETLLQWRKAIEELWIDYSYYVSELIKEQTNHTKDDVEKKLNESDSRKLLKQYRRWLWEWYKVVKKTKQRVIVTLDGRDTAWKWSNILKVIESFRNNSFFKEIATPVPSVVDKFEYNHFLRYMQNFPNEKKWWITFYDRSWYNRALVEAVMWFCTEEQYLWFMENVNKFEKTQIVDKWIILEKIYLSIPRHVQEKRIEDRWNDLAQEHKVSFVDSDALNKWHYYTLAKKLMLEQTDTENAHWNIINSTNKYLSAIEIIKLIINSTPDVAKRIDLNLEANKDLALQLPKGTKSKVFLDLESDDEITRKAKPELERMESNWDFLGMAEKLNFWVMNENDIKEIEEFKKNYLFDKEKYRYIKK